MLGSLYRAADGEMHGLVSAAEPYDFEFRIQIWRGRTAAPRLIAIATLMSRPEIPSSQSQAGDTESRRKIQRNEADGKRGIGDHGQCGLSGITQPDGNAHCVLVRTQPLKRYQI